MKRRLALVLEDEDDYAAIRVAARSIHGTKDPTDEQMGEAIAQICRAHLDAAWKPVAAPAELPGQTKLFPDVV
jgi:hypothetical protein